ncbi:LytR/AlgR family response regulator transcription factor [Mucilaginibacter kameinonensis]|uniref:LytR/AlgR family response regulator transcription factor n=1 Tax=Mucilaginibacter kameinonensis TaxID=452286 RepID=UPI000EF7C324|nr:LytTR family DNA-binding domain-containing protein [Mucilaginibacter kameinonensis]
MSYTCYIVDDDADAIGLLEEYIGQTDELDLVGSSLSPVTALREITRDGAPDITFIDVDMRGMNGIELAGLVNLYTNVVFTTAFPEYALQAFEKAAYDYILKPINYERFYRSIQNIKHKMKKARRGNKLALDEFFNIKSELKERMVKVKTEDVIYVEGAGNYIIIHTAGNEKHMTYLTMREIEHYLPRQLFARVHRSFIVNMNHVKVIERNRVLLLNEKELVMGDYYKKRFLDIMDGKLIRTDRKP